MLGINKPVVTKTATVPGGTADHAGEVISYAITIHNTGNVTLTNPVVSDPSVGDLAQVQSGGFNAGDTDHDGKLDVGETWQYSASHTVTQTDIDTNGSPQTDLLTPALLDRLVRPDAGRPTVAFVHWGREYVDAPAVRETLLADAMRLRSVAAIIGGSKH